MPNTTYLNWVISNTKTEWWHDSADLAELQIGLERGAVGVTTNPFLSNIAVQKYKSQWAAEVAQVLAENPNAERKAEALMKLAVAKVAQKLIPQYEGSAKRSGFVCAQVNPARAGNRPEMISMARRRHNW